MKKLATPEELSGILNWGFEGLKRLRGNGWNFSNTKSLDDTREEYKRKSDPICSFANYCLEEESDAFEPKEELYQAFKAYSEAEGLPPMSKDFFYIHLPEKVTVASGRKGTKGSQKHCFLGIRLSEGGRRYSLDQKTLTTLTTAPTESDPR